MINGIQQLVAVSQLKSRSANDEALNGADKQKDLIKNQKAFRKAKRVLESVISGGTLDKAKWKKLKSAHAELYKHGLVDNYDNRGPAFYWTNSAHTEIGLGDKNKWFKNNQSTVDRLTGIYDDGLEDLAAQDDLGNFEIQDLMSSFNQAETLASSLRKKLDDASSAVVAKV